MNIEKDFSGWRYYKDFLGNTVGIMIVHSPEFQESRLLQDPEVQEWLASGNQPLPADEVTQ